MIAAAPAYASSNAAYVVGGTGYQYQVTCQSAGTCNSATGGTLEIQFARSGAMDPRTLGVFYQIINGTAVNGCSTAAAAACPLILLRRSADH
jgi:hypothetical protein